MVRKLALASLFFSGGNVVDASLSSPSMSASSSTASSWQWPSCTQARTLSFGARDVDGGGRSAGMTSSSSARHHHHHSRRQGQEECCYKTSVINPAYFLDDHHSCRSSSSSAAAASAVNMSEEKTVESTAAAVVGSEVDEVIIRGLRSNDRLFFEPESTSSIVVKTAAEATTATATTAFDGATAMSIDSADPYGDFRRSMEEMVMSHDGANDWGWLEEMLGWYLSANGKKTHGLIVGAFVDLLVALATSPPTAAAAAAAAACSSSAASSFMALDVAKKGKQRSATF